MSLLVVTLVLLPLLVGSSLDTLVYPERGYDESFFAQHSAIAPVYPLLVEMMLAEITPPPQGRSLPVQYSVVDVGCGHGLLVEAWRSAGISESYGMEGSNAAKHMWPPEFRQHYYQIQDLTLWQEAAINMPETDLVTTLEVAEHLPETSADHFIQLLATHRPATIVFGAATPFQDQGLNPGHVNENTFAYWTEKFAHQQYALDFVATARIRHKLLMDKRFQPYFISAWWYPKNILIFRDTQKVPKNDDDDDDDDMDLKLVRHPKEANMWSDAYLNIGYAINDGGAFGQLWKRDWMEFATMFYREQDKARERLLLKDQTTREKEL